MNSSNILGRMVRDPELRQGNTQVLKATVAVDRRFKKEGQPTADFINIVAFGKTAENIAKFFKKGSMIGISGHIQTGSYDHKDGHKVYTTEVIVDNFSFTGAKEDSTPAAQTVEKGGGFFPIDEDDSGLPF